MTKYTPVFAKDGDTYVVPTADFVQDTAELADVAGVAAGLNSTYGLSYTGRTAEVNDDGSYPGPFVIAQVADLTVNIVGGASIADLIAAGNPAVQNLPVSDTNAE